MVKHVQQILRVRIDRTHSQGFKNSGKCPLQRIAIFQQIRSTGRAAAIVLEHVINPVAPTDQIASANVNVSIRRHIDSPELRAVVLRLLDVETRNHLILQDLLIVINIVQKQIQGDDALRESSLQVFPLARRHHPRDRIKRENPLGPLVVVIHVERDALS